MSPLHIDKRPSTLDGVYGNQGIKESIQSVFGREDKPHATLLIGPSGSGKTTLARIIATMIGCAATDVYEYNSSNSRGIDTIREINQNAQFAPMNGNVKVYLLDEVHKTTNDGQNALLKLLEDTPKHVYFILCTTDPEKLLKAIKTRCMTFEVKALANPQMAKLVEDTIVSEGIDLKDWPSEVTKAIVKAADGCPRQALIVLDSVIDIEDETAQLAAVAESTASETASIELCRVIIETRKNRWDDARFLMKGLSDEPEKLRYAILGYLDAVLMGEKCSDPMRIVNLIMCFTESCMYSGKAGLHAAVFEACTL